MTSIALKQPMRLIIQHHMNSLHVYSFLCRRLKMSRKNAMKTAKVYERVIHPLLYF